MQQSLYRRYQREWFLVALLILGITLFCSQFSVSSRMSSSLYDKVGRGISEENQKMLFTRFTRVSPGEADDSGGLGLGLLFVKTVVTRHHGEIRVRSAPACGSDFIVRLPKIEPEEADEPSLSPAYRPSGHPA